jgi:hypothetical protein
MLPLRAAKPMVYTLSATARSDSVHTLPANHAAMLDINDDAYSHPQ